MFFNRFFAGTFYNYDSVMELYRSADNKIFARAFKSYYCDPIEIPLKKGAYDVFLVAELDEEDGGYFYEGAFILPSGTPFPFTVEAVKEYECDTYVRDIYCLTSKSVTESALGSDKGIHRDSYYCVRDIVDNRDKDLIPWQLLTNLADFCNENGGIEKIRYEHLEGNTLLNWANEKGVPPRFRLNSSLVRSSHFVEDCYGNIRNTGEAPLSAIMGGVQFFTGYKISVYRFGDGLFLSLCSRDGIEKHIEDIRKAFTV